MSFKIPKLSESTGMKVFEPLPKAEYLMKVSDITIENVEDAQGVVVAANFKVESVVENAENLPKGIEKGDVVGKMFLDFIYVMSPEHEKYNEVSKSGSTIGEIGIDNVKSFLDAVGVPIKNDAFNEKLAIGKYFEASIGTRAYKKDGEDRVGNRVNAYRSASDVGSDSAVEADADVPDDFEGDLE